jgi:glyoxylase-like metal-dependent hydrolase (beta-lactamase superfamily II)
MLKVETFVLGPIGNNFYLLTCEEAQRCAVVDPGLGSEEVLDTIRHRGLVVDYVLITHAHFDHVAGNAKFVEATGAPLAMHPDDMPLLENMVPIAEKWGFSGAVASPPPAILLTHGQVIRVGDSDIEVWHTPGHTPGHVAFIFPGNAIVGDTLFYRGIGRWDVPGANYDAMVRSIREQLFTLPDDTVVWPGHGQSTTIGEEKRLNPYVGEGAHLTPKL